MKCALSLIAMVVVAANSRAHIPFYDLGPKQEPFSHVGTGQSFCYGGKVYLSRPESSGVFGAVEWTPQGGFRSFQRGEGVVDQILLGVGSDGTLYGCNELGTGLGMWDSHGAEFVRTFAEEPTGHLMGWASDDGRGHRFFNSGVEPKVWDGSHLIHLGAGGPDEGATGTITSIHSQGVAGWLNRRGSFGTDGAWWTPEAGLSRISPVFSGSGDSSSTEVIDADRSGHVFGHERTSLVDAGFVWDRQHGSQAFVTSDGTRLTRGQAGFVGNDDAYYFMGGNGSFYRQFRWTEATGAVPLFEAGSTVALFGQDRVGHFYGFDSATGDDFVIQSNGVRVNLGDLARIQGATQTGSLSPKDQRDQLVGTYTIFGQGQSLFTWSEQEGMQLLPFVAAPSSDNFLTEEGIEGGGYRAYALHWQRLSSSGAEVGVLACVYRHDVGYRYVGDLFDPTLANGWTFESITSIDTTGLVLGTGRYHGQVRWYAFQMVPEPETWAALGLGSWAMLRRRGKLSSRLPN